MKYRLRRRNLQSGKEPVPDGPVLAGAVSVGAVSHGPDAGRTGFFLTPRPAPSPAL